MNTRLSHSLLTIIRLIVICFLALGAAGAPAPALARVEAYVYSEGSIVDNDYDDLADTYEANLIGMYAPEVRLDSHEDNFPSSVDWYLERVNMWWGTDQNSAVSVIPEPPVTLSNLLSQSHTDAALGTQYSGAVQQAAHGQTPYTLTNFFLSIPIATQDSIRPGDLTQVYTDANGKSIGTWPCYAHVYRRWDTSDHPGMIDVAYWFFYPYNGDLHLLGPEGDEINSVGYHEGDWERIVIRLDAAGRLHSVYYGRHSGEGRWYGPDEIEWKDGTRPVVYSAKHSHASYTNDGVLDGKQYRPLPNNFIPDFANGDGIVWNCSANLINLGERDYPTAGNEWLQFTGKWGQLQEQNDAHPAGPSGPAIKSNWLGEPANPNAIVHAGPTLNWTAELTAVPMYSNAFYLGDFTHNAAGPWMVQVYWGDGTYSQFDVTTTGDLPRTSHIYTQVGTYHVDVLVYDMTSAIGTAGRGTFKVVVDHDYPHLLPARDQESEPSVSHTFNLGSFVDYALPPYAGPWNVRVSWGDGTFTELNGLTAYGILPPTTHTYAGIGPYSVGIQVTNTVTGKAGFGSFTVIGDPAQTGPTYYPTKFTAGNDGRCGVNDCSLQEAIQTANADGVPSWIELSVGTYQGIYQQRENEIRSPITINGKGALGPPSQVTKIQGEEGVSRLFHVYSGALNVNRILLANNIITSAGAGDGGAILNDVYGSLNLNDSAMVGNQVIPGKGGAIANYGHLVINRSILMSNKGAGGGALYNKGMAAIVNSMISENRSYSPFNSVPPLGYLPKPGGAIFNDTEGNLAILSSTFFKNQGGISCTGDTNTGSANLCNLGTATVKNTILSSDINFIVESRFTFPNQSCSGNALAATSILYTDSSCGSAPVTNATLNLSGGMPLPGSPAIDRGDRAACDLNSDGNYTNDPDLRGYNRFVDSPGDVDNIAQCDIGAYEYNSTPLPPPTSGDEEPPMVGILQTPNFPDGNHDWYRNPVTFQPLAIDDSLVIELRCALDPETAPATFDDLPVELCPFLEGAAVEADGSHAFYAAAMDSLGNTSEIVSTSFQIDTTPPTLTCPAAGPFLLNSGDQPIGPAGVDAGVSGLDEALSTLSGILTTDSVGAKPLTFTAFDLAGNSSSLECSYNVIYDFGGFYPPIEPAPALNTAEAGSALPLKFSLAGDQGLDILAAGFPIAQQVDPQTLEPVGDPVATRPAGNSGLSYDPETGWYNYVWKTDKKWTGTTWLLTIELIDGTQHVAYFMFQ